MTTLIPSYIISWLYESFLHIVALAGVVELVIAPLSRHVASSSVLDQILLEMI